MNTNIKSCFVVFLDVDGVLNTRRTCVHAPSGMYIGVDEARIELLSNAMKETCADGVILTTTWKNMREDEEDYIYLVKSLAKFGIKVIGKTKEERLASREEGILKYYGDTENANVLTLKDFGFDDVFNGVVKYLKSNPKTEVIIATGIRITTDAIISAVNSLKLSIPKDIKLMIFDSDFSSTELNLFQPYIIEQNAYQIGYQSAAALYNQIYGDLRAEIIRLPVKIIDYADTFSGRLE